MHTTAAVLMLFAHLLYNGIDGRLMRSFERCYDIQTVLVPKSA